MWDAAIVYVIDDDDAFRASVEALVRSVSLKVKGYRSADSFLEQWSPHHPGCVLLDLRIPDMNGLQLQERLRRQGRNIPVVFLSGHGDVPTAVRAMRNGAYEFLTKPCSEEDLLAAIQKAVRLDIEHCEEWQQREVLLARWNVLTPREQQVFEGVVNGKANKEVARDLGISPKTVELHRSNLMAKMHAKSLPDLVQKYIRLKGYWADNAEIGGLSRSSAA